MQTWVVFGWEQTSKCKHANGEVHRAKQWSLYWIICVKLQFKKHASCKIKVHHTKLQSSSIFQLHFYISLGAHVVQCTFTYYRMHLLILHSACPHLNTYFYLFDPFPYKHNLINCSHLHSFIEIIQVKYANKLN